LHQLARAAPRWRDVGGPAGSQEELAKRLAELAALVPETRGRRPAAGTTPLAPAGSMIILE
jgi:hypothetical protein